MNAVSSSGKRTRRKRRSNKRKTIKSGSSVQNLFKRWFANLYALPFFKHLQQINNSKFFAGAIMIMLNIGSKYIVVKLSKSQEQYLKNTLGRQLLIFSIAWMGTRDILTALIITTLFYLMTMHLFNEESKFCIIPTKMRSLYHLIDADEDNNVSEEEIEKAKEILDKAKFKEQQQKARRDSLLQKNNQL